MSLDHTIVLAAEHQRHLHADAAQRALVRLATCCRPSALRRTLHAWAERLRPSRPCCA